MMRTTFAVTLLAAAVVAGCNRKLPQGEQPETGPAPTPPATALTAEADDGQWLMAAKDYANTRYQRPPGNHDSERLEPQAGVVVLDRRPAWTGSGAAGREQHDVRRHALPEHALRARPDATGRAGQVDVQAEAVRGRAGRGLLRRGEPRCGIRRRKGRIQHARQPHGSGRRAHGAAGLERHARRHQPRRDADDGADYRQRARCWSATAVESWASAAG